MTITELRQELERLEAAGKGDYEIVYCDYYAEAIAEYPINRTQVESVNKKLELS